VEYPLSAEDLVVALYDVAELQDIAGDEGLSGTVAVTLSIEGRPGLTTRAREIHRQEQDGTIGSNRLPPAAVPHPRDRPARA
jgi:hypothetical protein